MGHIQTETPYYQPAPLTPEPFAGASSFPGDPSFASCITDGCRAAWGLRITDSQDVTLHSAGLYSFFNDFYVDCSDTGSENCQDKILEVKGSSGVVVFNLFTIGTTTIASGINNASVLLSESNQRGFTSEVSVWIPLPGADNSDIVYVGTEIWATPTVHCPPPCTLVLPNSTVPAGMTISPGDYTTSFEYGHTTVTIVGAQTVTTFVTSTTTVTINIPEITIPSGGGMPYSNMPITQTTTGFLAIPSLPLPAATVSLPDGSGGTTVRSVTLPPWPAVTDGPADTASSMVLPPVSVTTSGGAVTLHTGVTTTVTATKPGITTLTFLTTMAGSFTCPPIKVVTFLDLSSGVFVQDCTSVSTITASPGTSTRSRTSALTTTTTTTPLPVWVTWPPGVIVPVTTSVSKPTPTPGGYVLPCKLWFFFICDDKGPDPILGWLWTLPLGIYPPGPPPWFKFRGSKISVSLPPWPKITVGPGGEVSYPDEPKSCNTETASLCGVTTVYSQTVGADRSTTTTAAATISGCETVFGCSLSNQATTATSTNQADGAW
ncbi:hypothetical protein HMPREF1624_02967 [Sporothrix schenckii ATCC 58251]|uniref:Uncharacterized protein n=1 Tax=Sporothrix schenckii (strain ATCC 58251 / de Perez 2211183) TaxID=1391915 RepID=U7PVI3_SPOS1|nr:hypothetical protein HMPREF1624_02967 [Sporothrix schenckii ATCC 58251]